MWIPVHPGNLPRMLSCMIAEKVISPYTIGTSLGKVFCLEKKPKN